MNRATSGYRYYNASTGRWLNLDPLGEAGCLNLYAFCYNKPLYGVDQLGLDFLQDAANYSAGVADSLTMGLTRVGRKGINWMFFDGYVDGVDPTSGAYVAGEITEVVVEVVITAGGATLRHIAKKTVRETVEKGARTKFKRANKLKGGIVHHANPIKGHPGGRIARFPLPFRWAARGHWNMTWLPSRAEHLAKHRRIIQLEALDEVREATMLVRAGGNELALYLNGAFPCGNWRVNVSANVLGSAWENGPLPPPSSTINVSATHVESGVEGYLGE